MTPFEPFRFDLPGLVLFSSFIWALLVLVEEVRQPLSARVWFAIALSLVVLLSLVLLSWREKRASNPLFPPSLMRNPTAWRCNAMAICHGAYFVSMLTFTPIYLRVVRDQSVVEIGLLMLPITFGSGLGSLVTGQIVSRIGRSAIFPSVGLAAFAVALAILGLYAESMSTAVFAWYLGAAALFTGTVMGIVQVTVQAEVGATMLGTSIGLISLARALGGAVGTALIGATLFATMAATGMEISTESQFAPTLGGVGTRAPIDLNRPDVFSPVVGLNIAPTGALSRGDTDTVAIYLFDAFDLGARLRLNGGLRVERYDTQSHSVAADGVVTDVEGKGTLVSGKAGLVFRLNDRGNLYVSYGSSLTPPGSANFQLNAAPTNQNNPNVDPQESTNYELGTKWDLANSRLQLSGAVFWTENRNVIFVVDGTAVPPVFNQDDGQRVRGATIGAVGRIAPWWDINMSLQYLDSKVESQNPATDAKRLALAPEVSGNLWTTVRLPHDVRVGGGLRSTDAVFISTANTIAIPGYTVADALAEAPIGQHLTIRLNIYNLTDRVYVRNINNNGGSYNPGSPRAFLVTSAVRF